MSKLEEELPGPLAGDVAASIEAKLGSDLHALASAIAGCRFCPRGGKGIPGCGEAGALLFFLAGMPGPGAERGDPWGGWRPLLQHKAAEMGWDLAGAYYSTALRCRLPKVTRWDLRRCAHFLAEELIMVGPRLVVVSGKVAAVALREALGDVIPENPMAGDTCSLYAMRFLFELDIARVVHEEKAAAVFWNILGGAEDLYGERQG
ncbi:MAG: uracil-DNA glycosylase family protein [Actinomycetota bacterium]